MNRSSLCFTRLDLLLPNGDRSVLQFGVIIVYSALALFSSHDYRKITGITLKFFTNIPLVVNLTFNATPTERLQKYQESNSNSDVEQGKKFF